MSVLLAARGVTKMLEGEFPVTLVSDATLEIGKKEFISIIGPSGSGKSSLLYLLGLLDHPTRGEILLEGQPTERLSQNALSALRLEKIGFIFQFHFLLPEFSALENVLLPMERLGRLNATERKARAMELLTQLGIEEGALKKPGQLSGGQRQRVAIARALANRPLLLLADEPTGNLDTANSHIVYDIFARLASEEQQTVVAVTHDMSLAERAFRQIKIVDGKIV